MAAFRIARCSCWQTPDAARARVRAVPAGAPLDSDSSLAKAAEANADGAKADDAEADEAKADDAAAESGSGE